MQRRSIAENTCGSCLLLQAEIQDRSVNQSNNTSDSTARLLRLHQHNSDSLHRNTRGLMLSLSMCLKTFIEANVIGIQ